MDAQEMEKERELGGTEKSWCKAVPGGTGIMVVAVAISRPIELSFLRTALQKLQDSNQILRAKLPLQRGVESFTISLAPYVEIESFDAVETSEILSRRIGASGEVSPFERLVEHDLNRNPWAVQAGSSAAAPAPVFFAATYAVPESETTIVSLRLHSAVCDRTTSSSVLWWLLGLLAEIEDGDGGERTAHPGIEEMTIMATAGKPFWARGRDILGYSFNFTRSACLPFQNTALPRSSAIARMVLTAAETSDLLSACKSRGVKLCGVLTAAMLLAALSSKHLPAGRSESYTVITMIDCRKFLDPKLDSLDLGFYNSAIQNAYSVREGEDLWEVADRCHGSLSKAIDGNRHITDMADLNLLMRKAIDNPILTPSSSMRTALLSVFEETVVYEPCHIYRRAGVEEFIACSSVHGVGPSVAVFDSIRDGQLQCDCLYPTPLHSREQIQALVDHAKSILVG
ncbi:unnamed protein product [Spirodela intermedia]|uniref:Phthiocerol/phthiodiolone dimycocerosyl transferase C-terminal domain-containing protein n=1 Tax=Spirodela intermedia TaxID=51605 RepID=A0A7I8L7U7_SPIIN|nr:unnamed protein product [Spirodela intermedia]